MSDQPVHLLSLATAVPERTVAQDAVEETAGALFVNGARDMFERLRPVYRNTGIAERRLAAPLDWYLAGHGWRERNRVFVEQGLVLVEEVALKCLDRAGLTPDALDAVILVSTTGLATPSLDALLAERMGLRRDLVRLPVFGLGCAGGALGLARGAALARAMPGKRILLVCVELCSLTFRMGELSKTNLIATALFGDGAAGAILSTEPGDGLPAIIGAAEHTWRDSLDIMGWRIEEDSFAVTLSRDLPAFVRANLRPALDGALEAQGLDLADFDGIVCHPGGAKVLEALEASLSQPAGSLDIERDVLRAYGNMSSPTVLFVLERAVKERLRGGRSLLSALGPGFSAGFVTLQR